MLGLDMISETLELVGNFSTTTLRTKSLSVTMPNGLTPSTTTRQPPNIGTHHRRRLKNCFIDIY